MNTTTHFDPWHNRHEINMEPEQMDRFSDEDSLFAGQPNDYSFLHHMVRTDGVISLHDTIKKENTIKQKILLYYVDHRGIKIQERIRRPN